MDVRLPNGVVIKNIPEGTSKDEIKAKAIQQGLATASDFGDVSDTQQEKPAVEPITSGYLMGLKDPITAGAQMLPRGLEYVSSLGGAAPNVVSRFFGSEARRMDELARAEEAAYQQARQEQGREGFDAMRLAGNIINPVNLAVGTGAARALGAVNPLMQAAGVGAATGAFQPVLGEDFAAEKARQAAVGAVGGVVGTAATKAAGKALNPLVSKAEQTMRELGVTLTPGQLLGKQPKALEEFAENIPLVGQYISNAKERQLFQFNKGVINKALAKVGKELDADVIGRDAVAEARNIVSQQYDDVLGRIKFELNPNITKALGGVVKNSKLTAAGQKQQLNDLIDDYIYKQIPVNNKGTGTIDGKAFKAIESDMLKKIRNLRSSSTDAERSLGEELGKALDVFKSAMRNQNQADSSILRRIDSAYGDLVVMETAAANTGAKNGVFTPKQYQTAVRQRDTTRSKSAFAAGRARGQEVSEAAMETINREQGSTVEGRLTMSLGGLYGSVQNPAVAAGVAVAAPAMYSQKGLQVMEALMRSRPELAKKLGDVLVKRATKEGSITGAQVLEEYNRMTRTQPQQ